MNNCWCGISDCWDNTDRAGEALWKSPALTNSPPGLDGRELHAEQCQVWRKATTQCPSCSGLTFEAELTCHRFCLGKDQIHHSHFGPSFPQGVGKGSANSLPSSCDISHPAIQTQPLQDAALVAAPEDFILQHLCLKQEHKHLHSEGQSSLTLWEWGGSMSRDPCLLGPLINIKSIANSSQKAPSSIQILISNRALRCQTMEQKGCALGRCYNHSTFRRGGYGISKSYKLTD